jgi:hypothetical protein
VGTSVSLNDPVGPVPLGRPNTPVKFEFFLYSNYLKIVNSKWKPSLDLKIFRLCMVLYRNILNNFLNWVDFKFSTEFML